MTLAGAGSMGGGGDAGCGSCGGGSSGGGLWMVVPESGGGGAGPRGGPPTGGNPTPKMPGDGCGCGTGGQSGFDPTAGDLPAQILYQPQNSIFPSCFGPGMFSPLNVTAYCSSSTNAGQIGVVSVRIFDPVLGRALSCRDNSPVNGVLSPVDGLLQQNYPYYKTVELMQGAALTTSLLNADKVRITRFDGTKLILGFGENNDTDAQYDRDARLTSVKNRNDHSLYTLTYNSNKNFAISTITDASGNVSSFVYDSPPTHVISCTFANGQPATISYVNNFLSQVNLPLGLKYTCSIAADPATQTTKITMDNPYGARRHFRVAPDFMEYDGQLIAQAANTLRALSDGADANNYSIYYDPADSSNSRLLQGGNRLVQVHQGETRFFYSSYTLGNPNNGYNAFTNLVLAAQESTNLGGLPGSQTDYVFGASTYATTTTGENLNFLYDSDKFVTRVNYPDGSYETYAYNVFKQVTRHRDRNANVTQMVYDAAGNLTERKVGFKEVSGSDVQQPEYAVYKFAYDGQGRLVTAFTPRWTNQTDLYRTDYQYDGIKFRLLKVIQSADVAGGPRPESVFTYNTAGLLATMTDPDGRVTTYSYENLDRLSQIQYGDGSTEKWIYGPTNVAGDDSKLLKSIDRNGVSTLYAYDSLGRIFNSERGYSTFSGTGAETVTTDRNLKSITDIEFVANTSVPFRLTTDGRRTEYVYDFRFRPLVTKQYPRTGVELVTTRQYINDRLFYTQDPYGRRDYMAYSASSSTELIRRVQGNHPGFTLANNAAVLALTRDASPNAAYVIADAIKDAEGNLIEVIDGRGTSTKFEYDSRDRQIRQKAAFGTSIEAKTESTYDAESNVVEVRSPRYFDSSDTNGFNLAKTTFTYNGRGLQASQTQTLNSSGTAVTTNEYFLDGRQKKSVDPRGYDHFTYWHTCCGNFQGSKDPAGHGNISNNDPVGRVTHTALVSDYATHANLHDPDNAKTLAESTTRFDILGRSTANTRWLVPRGVVDPYNVPIAGLGAPNADGITSQTIFDVNMADGIGLDSPGGVAVTKLSGGTYNISLSNCLTKLADTPANGGAGITFSGTQSAASAVVSISPTEELSVSISDGSGRNVMSAQIQGWQGSSPNALVTWNCAKHDTITNVAGFGDCLESQSIDALGNINKSLADGSGRTLRSIDASGNISTGEYDAAGNVTKSRDPNGVGYDAAYDVLGRMTSQTDTWGDITSMAYDKAGNAKSQTDAKNKTTTIAYDAANRRKSTTDRINGVTQFAYDSASNQLSITDAENQVTNYGYDSRGIKVSETYPDHTGGVSGSSTYGILAFSPDAAGRVQLKTDQNGDTVTFNFDLAGRMTQRDYRLKVNSPTGTIADSDTFTFDKSSRMLTGISGRYTNTVAMTYSANDGRLQNESLTIAGQTYTVGRTYDARGNLFQMTYPNGAVVERAYTNRGQLNTVKYKDTAGGTLNTEDTRSYDLGGRLSTSAYRNGVTTTNAYRTSGSQKDNMFASISFAHPAGVTSDDDKVGTHTYAWDANKNKSSETITGAATAYINFGFTTAGGSDPDGYDDDDRLVYFKRTGTTNPQTWNLSLVGDWNSYSDFGTNQNRTHGPTHEILTAGATPSNVVTHDVKGNFTDIPTNISSPARKLLWDFDNRLKGVDNTGDSIADVTYEFDALGRRVARTQGSTAVVYIPVGQQTIADYTRGTAASTTPLYRYVFGDYIDEPILRQTGSTSIHYYHHNQQYSTVALTTSTGFVTERYAYTAYGVLSILTNTGTTRPWTDTSNRFTYTGREWDDTTKMFHFRARWYEPQLGRFIGRDPLAYIDGRSLFRAYFVPNDLDPLGLTTSVVDDKTRPPEFQTRPREDVLDVNKKCKIKSVRFICRTMPAIRHLDIVHHCYLVFLDGNGKPVDVFSGQQIDHGKLGFIRLERTLFCEVDRV